MDYEAKARECIEKCADEASISSPGELWALVPTIAAALKQAVDEERAEIITIIDSFTGKNEPTRPMPVLRELKATIRRRRELPHLASCKIEGEVA